MANSRSSRSRKKHTFFRGYGASGVARMSTRGPGAALLAALMLTGCWEEWYADQDGDGFGDPAYAKHAPWRPEGFVPDAMDCDDGDSAVHPAAQETCNGVDDDCSGTVDGDDVCGEHPCDELSYGDHSYLFCAEQVDWEDAQESCASYGYTMLSLADAEEEAWVYEQLIEPKPEWWMGFNDLEAEGSWAWEDGSPVTYVNWHREDKRKDLVGKDCARLNRYEPDTGWYDSPCTVKAQFICEQGGGQLEELQTWYLDADGDGWGEHGSSVLAVEALSGHVSADMVGDCDDYDASVHPGADELCNQVDDDCDGGVDEDAIDPSTWYADGDMDGYGDAGRAASACSCPVGFVASADDCDDGDAGTSPSGVESCDGIDNDCDGSTDEDASDASIWYADADADGYGDASSSQAACSCPTGFVASADDCDDGDAGTSPSGVESCDGIDNDCDGSTDEDATDAPIWYADADGDGYGDAAASQVACSCPAGFVASADDCDDGDAGTSPSGVESCDGIDNDCDGSTDDDASDASIWYADVDADGYGDAAVTMAACSCPGGFVATPDDCDDGVVSSAPMGPELCDGIDNDCDGATDEDDAVDASRWWRDEDGDGYGDPEISALSCYIIPEYVHNDLDCDDSQAISNPGAPELCDGLDNDCDAVVDDAPIDSLVWYADTDDDGFGATASLVIACEQPEGHVLLNGDCDDVDARVNPDAAERCNGLDDDCDGAVDLDPSDGDTYHIDMDGDGYGGALGSTVACSQPAGYADNDQDCHDGAPLTFPGADERCNDVDDDCDGSVDEAAVDAPTWYADADGDGYGSSRSDQVACAAPSGHVAEPGDCNDANAAAFPGADELCNGSDDDCDGERDEDDAIDAGSWFLDVDGDGYGVASTTLQACSAPSGYASPDAAQDCDDTVSAVHPGAVERCDGVDDDCDGEIDEEPGEGPLWYLDADADGHGDPAQSVVACSAPSGYEAIGDDCDDSDIASWHGPAWYADADSDGYGDPATSSFGCSAPEGYVASADDCDDTQRGINPGAAERCNGLDDDCDGSSDEAATDALTFYVDGDGDGYGHSGSPQVGCEAAAGQVADASDCDDGDAETHPGADEHCDGHDDDCDGVVDESDAVDAPPWHRDADADGWGSPSLSTAACSAPDGYVALSQASDCDDGDDAVHPGADEACNGLDDDCDGAVDEDDARDAIAWYLDSDGDGYGNPSAEQLSCDSVSGYVDNDGDCNDADPAVRPGVDELCNGADDDCDGTRDEDALDMVDWYQDEDGDGWGLLGLVSVACDAPEGHSGSAGDCDDLDAMVSPDADELCNDVDDDCDGVTDEDDAVDAAAWYVDTDGDGWGTGPARVACVAIGAEVDRDGDCEDGDPGISPDATERCDGVDEDCDGVVDVGAIDAATWYRDGDGDGWGDASRSQQACEQPAGTSALAGDCDDGSLAVVPGAMEICDGLDNDCDGAVDVGAVDQATWYQDSDGDGWGTPASIAVSCEAPSGYVAVPGDCDDSEPSGAPGAEYCDGFDNDCDGIVDEPESLDASLWYRDRDADGVGDFETTALACYQPYEFVLAAGDCDDLDPVRYPDNIELCDGIDNDCDEMVDEDAVGRITWYEDGDLDGFGDVATASLACEAPDGWLTDGSDCDDADPGRNPGASEICNGADDDCDGVADEDALDAITWYADADADGSGVADGTTSACDLPDGFAVSDDDCDDTTAAVHPGATELCDGLDNDCDGEADESDAADATRWFLDVDGDGYGDASVGAESCTQPVGWIDQGEDCDDGDAGVNPGAIEGCNGIDDDCDGRVDLGAVDAIRWYSDSDADGYGDPGDERLACEQPAGSVLDATDCDDSSEAVHPAADELCNQVDDDCDGLVDDDALDGLTWYMDADSDGYGLASAAAYACQRPDGHVADAGDCDDTVAVAHPGAPEVCDGLDNDCDAVADEDDAVDARRWYSDGDGDGFGLKSSSHVSCDAPEGWVSSRTDCDDTDAFVNPDATEICNGIDDDCDAVIDLDSTEIISQWPDNDGDGYGARGTALQACELQPGYVTLKGDCDDAAASINPGASERCNDLDDDCDILVDEDDAVDIRSWHRDRDKDGYGSPTSITTSCAAPDGYVSNDLDCDDSTDMVSPDAMETCKDGVDNDCDGLFDDCMGWPVEGALSAAEAVLVGEAASSKSGNALAAMGDLDGDGYGDLAVGASGEDSSERNAGAVYLVDGPLMGETSLATANGKLTGENASDGAGWSVASAGDVNGDGQVDLLVGAKGFDGAGSDSGIAYLVYGPVSGELGLGAADARLLGMAEDDRAGCAVAGVGDVNADGWDDVLVGAFGDSSAGVSAGAAYLFLGPVSGSSLLSTADARLLGAAAKDFAGTSLAGVGDTDGDGYDDMLVGAWGQDSGRTGAGAVHLVLGPAYGEVDLGAADATLYGAARGDKFGGFVARAGDFDGDGHDDVLVGAEGEDSGGDLAGAAYLFYGPLEDGLGAEQADLVLVGASRDERAGVSVAVAGDLNGDGWGDLAVGAPGAKINGTGSGAVYIVFGAGEGTVDLSTDALCFAGTALGDNAGLAVAGPGDVNGDGLDDLAVGAESADHPEAQAGAVYLLAGMLGAVD